MMGVELLQELTRHLECTGGRICRVDDDRALVPLRTYRVRDGFVQYHSGDPGTEPPRWSQARLLCWPVSKDRTGIAEAFRIYGDGDHTLSRLDIEKLQALGVEVTTPYDGLLLID